jgi:hypothetical protein
VRAIYQFKHELEEQMQQNKKILFLARNLQLQASDKRKIQQCGVNA